MVVEVKPSRFRRPVRMTSSLQAELAGVQMGSELAPLCAKLSRVWLQPQKTQNFAENAKKSHIFPVIAYFFACGTLLGGFNTRQVIGLSVC